MDEDQWDGDTKAEVVSGPALRVRDEGEEKVDGGGKDRHDPPTTAA